MVLLVVAAVVLLVLVVVVVPLLMLVLCRLDSPLSNSAVWRLAGSRMEIAAASFALSPLPCSWLPFPLVRWYSAECNCSSANPSDHRHHHQQQHQRW